MRKSPVRLRLALLSGAAFLPLVLAAPAGAQTICSQAADGTVTCTEGAEVVASGTMTPGTVVTGPGLVVPLTSDQVAGAITGNISTSGAGETAVSLSADSVDYVQNGDILAIGAGSGGLSIFAFGGVSASVGEIESDGAGASVFADFGSVSLTTGNVTTNGDGGFGARVFSEESGVTLIVGNVITRGDSAAGVGAGTDFNILVRCGDIHTFGDNSTGLGIGGHEGDSDVLCGNVTTEGDDSTGARFTALQGFHDAQLGDVSTLGDRSDGIHFASWFSGVLSVGDVTTQGFDSDGIYVEGIQGHLRLTAGDVVTLGDDSSAIEATTAPEFAFGGGDVAIQAGNISTSGHNSAGVLATAATDVDFDEDGNNFLVGGNLVLTAGDISTSGDNSPAIVAVAEADATVTVGNVSTAGANSGGIDITAGGPDLFDPPFGDIDLTCGNVTTTGADSTAISLFSNSSVEVSCGDISAAGAGSHGLLIGSERITATAGDIVSSGIGVGIDHLDFGLTNVTVGNVTTAGDGGTGVSVDADDGSASITCGDVTTLGNDATGLRTSASDGGVQVTCGDIRTEGDGSEAASLGDSTSFALGNLTTIGNGSAGLEVASFSGAIGSAGDISTSGDNSAGIAAFTDFLRLTAGDVTTSGDGSIGVLAEGGTSELDLQLGQVTTSGAGSHGIDITFGTSSGLGTVLSISVQGVSVAGPNADGIRIDTISGGIGPTLAISGDVTSVDGTAISVASGGTFDFDVPESVLVSGRTGGIFFDGRTLAHVPVGSLVLDIAGAVAATEGPAIGALGGPATVDIAATGSVTGFLTFGDGDDTVTNAGLFTALGTSDFAAGSDIFTNSNLLVVDGDVAFAGLESFANAGGTIDMQDGAPNDRFEVSGDFGGGDGSSVLLDVSRSLDAADVLAVGGDVNGQTLLDIEWIDSDAPVNAGGVLLVEGSADASAFTVSGLEDFGLFALTLRAQGDDLFLMAAIDPAAADLLLLGSVVPDTWYQSFDALRASIAGRGSLLPRLGLWGQAYGGRDRSGERGTVELFGSEMEASSRLVTERLGAQLGFDTSVGAVLVGVTAGYEKADADAGLTSEIEAEGYNIGAYAAVGAAIGPYAIVTVKHDRLDLDFNNAALAVPDLDGTSTGGDVEAGWRGSLGLLALDLNAGVSVVRSDIDGFAIDGTEFEPEGGTSVRGRLGGRVTFAGPWRPFAEARLFHEFGEDSRLAILSGDIEEEVEGAGRGTWARLEAGIGGGNDRPLVSAYADVGDREGWGLRAGFRF